MQLMVGGVSLTGARRSVLALVPLAAWSVVPSTGSSQTSPPPELVVGIAHIAFLTTDIARAARFYGDVLGYASATSPAAGRRRLIFQVNARQQIVIEDGLPAGQDERLSHVAFQTANLPLLREHLKRAGITGSALESRSSDASGIRVTDPDGHAIEFVEHNQSLPTATRGAGAVSTRILHIGLSVRDAAVADRFYRDVLGFSETWRGGATDGVTSWINMRVPGGTDYLEYMLRATPPTRQQLGSMHHVALRVPDIQESLELVRSRWHSTDGPLGVPRIGRNNRWQLNLFDPDGTRTELMEPYTVR